MDERELRAATSAMLNARITESYVAGEIDENRIENLRKQGLIIDDVSGGQKSIETPGRDSELLGGIKQVKTRATLLGGAANASLGPSELSVPRYYLIEIEGPLLEEVRSEFLQRGIELLEYVPHNSYTAKLTRNQAADIKLLPIVVSVRPYGANDVGPIILSKKKKKEVTTLGPASIAGEKMFFDIRLHSEDTNITVLGRLNTLGVTVIGAIKKKIRIEIAADSENLEQISLWPEVAEIAEYVPPKLFNDFARRILGIDGGDPHNSDSIQYSGEGQIVGIADTGIDSEHPDLSRRIIKIISRGRENDHSDPHGHGTHVAGSIVGDGSSSNGTIRGTAPNARIVFQSLLDSKGELGGLPLDLGELFEQAYKDGVRIHNNSWGSSTPSYYTFSSMEVDEYVSKRKDMLIVIAAGNEGQSSERRNSKAGFVDWLSIGSPASCKNALTVGASRSDRMNGAYSGFTYNEAFGDSFPDAPIADQKVSGDSECLAAFSSRGPCDDRRIKPDVVACGTDIASTKSSAAPLRNFWGPYPENDKYAFMGGTSMATPLIAGCAAIVREYYVKERKHNPSAALLKATLINSTKWLSGTDSNADIATMPNYHQGFGLVYLPFAIPSSMRPNYRLDFMDSWQDGHMQFIRTGQKFRFKISISGSEQMRICLTWTDAPGRGLQNNLNLFLQHVATSQKWIGNQDLPNGLNVPDPDNNVEVIRLSNPPPGEYIIQITATNLLKMPQDFALVIVGDLVSSLKQYS